MPTSRLAMLALPLALLAWSKPALAQNLDLEADLQLLSTYVFRGAPQYATLETPALQLHAYAASPHKQGAWWVDLRATSVLTRRSLHDRLGSADEITPSAGYVWRFSNQWHLTTGLVSYLRPSNEPLDLRDELFAHLDWHVLHNRDWKLTPHLALYGEPLRRKGLYAQLGASARRNLGYGFFFTASLTGGGGGYAEGAESFNHGAFAVEMAYEPVPKFQISGRITAVATAEDVAPGDSFLERHGLVWNALVLRYTPFASPVSTQPTEPAP